MQFLKNLWWIIIRHIEVVHDDLLESWTPDVAGRVDRSPATRYTDLHKQETVCYYTVKIKFKTGSFSSIFRT
jgi:hypothetical protein